MDDGARQTRVREHVERFLDRGGPLDSFLQSVEPELRDDVANQCDDGRFVAAFFDAMPKASAMAPRPDRIGGCEVAELLGQGAMGQVYRARQVQLQRDVAIKLIRTEYAQQVDFLGRFREEARLLASIDHPGIVKVLSFGAEGEWLYFVMELVAGPSLAAALPGFARGSGSRRFDRTARIVAEVLDALAYVHHQGIVHRDVKPSNIVLDANDHPKLVDFGLARASESPLLTQQGILVGTPAFLSPELASHRSGDRAGADCWAVGVLLFQLLTGKLPFTGSTADEVLTAVLAGTRADARQHVADLPMDLAAIAARALAPDPLERYARASDFAADLRRYLAGEPVQARRRSLSARVRRHLHRWRRYYAIAATCGITWMAADAWLRGKNTTADVTHFLSAPTPTNGETDDLVHLVRAGRRLLAGTELSAAQRRDVTARVQELEQQSRNLHAAGVEQVRLGAGSPIQTPVDAFELPSPTHQVEGSKRVAVATMAVPELRDLVRVMQDAMPHLVVEDPEDGRHADVRVDELHPITSLPRVAARDRTPCVLALPPGQYRVVVGDETAFAECSRTLLAPGRYVIRPVLANPQDVSRGMRHVAGGEMVAGQQKGVIYAERTVVLRDFLIDEGEVTCGEYHDYCLAHNHPFPGIWDDCYDPRWARLPVVGLDFVDAALYAESIGKRLATLFEWQAAACGLDRARYPWGDDPSHIQELTTIGHPERPWYQGLASVGREPRDLARCGAWDMFGNACEWTDTPYVGQLEGVPVPFRAWHVVGGFEWQTRLENCLSIPFDSITPGPPESRNVGFRCAKSRHP